MDMVQLGVNGWKNNNKCDPFSGLSILNMVLYYSLLAIFVSWTWFNLVLMDGKTTTSVIPLVVYQF